MIKRPTFNFDKDLFKRSVEYNVRTMYRRTMKEATDQQVFQASAMALKDQIIDCWMRTQKVFDEKDPKQVVYLSMEFLMGRAFGNDAINLMAYEPSSTKRIPSRSFTCPWSSSWAAHSAMTPST